MRNTDHAPCLGLSPPPDWFLQSGPSNSSKIPPPDPVLLLRSPSAPARRSNSSSSACAGCCVPQAARSTHAGGRVPGHGRSIASETNSLGSPAPAAPAGIFLSPHLGRARGAREARAVPAARLLGGRPYHPRLPPPLESHQSQTSATPRARPGGASGRGVRMGEHFLGPASTAPSTHFLQERERGSQARRHLQICSASNNSHNIPQFTVPPAGPFRPKPAGPAGPHENPAPRPPPGPARNSQREDPLFSKAEPGQWSRKFGTSHSGSASRSPPRLSSLRGEARRSPHKSSLTPGPAASSLPFLESSSSPPRLWRLH